MNFIKINKKINKNGGFLVLTMVLIVCATVLIIVTGSLLRSIGEVNNTSDSEKALKAWSVVNACGEYALLQMMGSTTSTTTTAINWGFASTTGVEVTNVGDGNETCYINVVEDTGDGSKLIKAESTVSGFTRKIQIIVATNTPDIIVNSWQAVADFTNE